MKKYIEKNYSVGDASSVHKKRILITGNGFDLAHNLPTSYMDFIKVINYLINMYDSKSNITAQTLSYVYGIKSPLNKENNGDNNINKCYNAHKEHINGTQLDNQKVMDMVRIAKINCWFKYFKINIHKDIKWIDFEKEIKYVLRIVEDFFIYARKDKVCSWADTIRFSSTDVGYELKFIVDIFNDLVSTNGPAIFHIKGEYCIKKYNHEGKGILIGLDEKKILNYLSNELIEFSKLFELYITEFINKISVDKSSAFELFKNIDAVITFNYTSTYTNIYNNIDKDKIVYVHGKAGEGNIVFGVDSDKHDNLEYLDTNFIKFKKFYQRINNGNLLAYQNVLPKNRNFELVFYGHSLDETDSDILKDLLTLGNTSCTIYHHNLDTKEEHIQNLCKLFGKEKLTELLQENRITFLLS